MKDTADQSGLPDLSGFHSLLEVIRKLRDPQGGCPWDLKQTHQSLRPYVLEEAYELVEAIDSGDMQHVKEELGDVLLQVVLHAQLATDAGYFTADEVAEAIAQKLIRRHPHVFGDVNVQNAEEVTRNWEAIKAEEKGSVAKSAMDDVPQGIPALSRALKVSKRAVKQGFEWPDFESLWACVMSEYDEFRQELDNKAPFENLEDELGDILFATVNLARYKGIDPEVALTKATNKFMRRYRTMESLSDKPLSEQPFETLDALWNKAKVVCRSKTEVSS
jgi:MazG family protein